MSDIERDYDRCPECGSPAIDPSGETLCICGGPAPTREEEEILALHEQLQGTVAALAELVATCDALGLPHGTNAEDARLRDALNKARAIGDWSTSITIIRPATRPALRGR